MFCFISQQFANIIYPINLYDDFSHVMTDNVKIAFLES